MKTEAILSRFKAVRKSGNGWTARCPSHDDRRNSLCIARGDGGKTLIDCKAGCSPEEIVREAGIEMSDLFESETGKSGKTTRARVVATYDYTDEQGNLLYQVRRTEDKQFPVYHKEGDRWVAGLNGQKRVLYRLPELVKSDLSEYVFIVEGEKDVENLAELGLTATTNPGGASKSGQKSKWREEYNEAFKARKVIILPDNDEAGKSHAQHIAASLKSFTSFVKIIELPGLPTKGDVSDWINYGGSVEKLIRLIKDSDRDNLGMVCLADVEAEHVEWLWFPYIPVGKLTLIEGDPGVGKSWLVLAIATAIAAGRGLPGAGISEPRNVLLLSAEDGLGDTIRPRLDSMYADCTRIFAFNRAVVFDDSGLLELEAVIAECRPGLVLVDPMVAYLGAGIDMHKANETRVVMAALARLAEKHSCAIVGVRHLSKAMGGKTIYRGIGSIDFTAACRSVLLVGADPDDKHKRAVVQIKNNLAAFGEPMGYEIRDDSFYWTGATGLTAERILSNSSEQEEKTALEEAVGYLRESLTEGDRDAKEISSDARALGISLRTLERARRELGIKALQNRSADQRRVSGWRWTLPENNGNGQDRHHDFFGGVEKNGASEDRQAVENKGSNDSLSRPPSQDRQWRSRFGGVENRSLNSADSGLTNPENTEKCQDRQKNHGGGVEDEEEF
jgi:putative DNA primase/helicase